ncbi:DUF1484 family protein [Ralstonia solanacearum]
MATSHPHHVTALRHRPECRTLHSLAAPLQTQLDQATSNVHRML